MPTPRPRSPAPRSLRLPVLLSLFGAAQVMALDGRGEERDPPLQLFVDAASPNEQKAQRALAALDEWWRDDYACILVDLARFMPPRQGSLLGGEQGTPRGEGFGAEAGMDGLGVAEPRGRGRGRGRPGGGFGGSFGNGGAGGSPGDGAMGVGPPPRGRGRPRETEGSKVRQRLMDFLEEQTGQDFGDDLRAWRLWHWSLPYAPHHGYRAFKAALYGRVDPRLGVFFEGEGETTIRLDEIEWSEMSPGRIPLLERPKHVAAEEARDLDGKDVVFGIVVGEEARAYPARILAWHELTIDQLGATELTIVSDPLCGTVIPYGNVVREKLHTFNASGLVYRSNRLIFDEETLTLWSTLAGRPVYGPLTVENVRLQAYPLVRTRWREWKAMHPGTTVLSTETGYHFDYSQEEPFRRYLDNDRLMFEVPRHDDRLKVKEPVLALALPRAGGEVNGERHALAIREKWLEKKENRVYQTRLAGHELVVVTSGDGAHRVYAAGDTRFVGEDGDGRLRDDSGGRWRLDEAALVPEAADESPKSRLPAHRALWFAWFAQFPDTELVK